MTTHTAFSELTQNSMSFESYPPPFRQQSPMVHSYDSSKTLEDSDFIPTIDLQCLNLDSLHDACKNWGLFRLVNHGVPPALLDQLQDHARMLFSVSFESKQTLFPSPLSYFWGTPALSPSGTALLMNTPRNINWVEGLNIPLPHLSQIQSQSLASFRYLINTLSLLFFS